MYIQKQIDRYEIMTTPNWQRMVETVDWKRKRFLVGWPNSQVGRPLCSSMNHDCLVAPPLYALLPLLILPHHTILSTILYLPLSTSGSFLFLSNVSPWFSYIHALLPNGRHLMLETFEVSPPIHGFFFLFPLIIDVWLHEKRNFVTYLCIYFLQ